jgi:hypothetical protein
MLNIYSFLKFKIMKISAEELYIRKVEGFLVGLKQKSKKVGDVDINHLLNQIKKTNPLMAIDLEDRFDIVTDNIKVVTW